MKDRAKVVVPPLSAGDGDHSAPKGREASLSALRRLGLRRLGARPPLAADAQKALPWLSLAEAGPRAWERQPPQARYARGAVGTS